MRPRVFATLSYGLKFLVQYGLHETQSAMETLFAALDSLGGLSVKLIQFICLRTDIFSEKNKIKLLSYYDEVPYEQINVRQVVSAELGTKISSFREIETTPFASGTFGQVYRGVLTDGVQVIVKIQRSHLRRKLGVDFALLRLAAFIFQLFYNPKVIDVPDLVDEFVDLTYGELDYRREAASANYFRRLYAGHPYVVVPRTYEELSTARVLVQEHIGGIAITQLIRAIRSDQLDQQAMPDRDTLRLFFRRLAYELGIQGLTREVFYADPHPGNIKLLPGGRFALIDFGIVGTSPKDRRHYYDMLELLLARSDALDTKKVSEVFLEWGAGKFYTHLGVMDDYFFDKDNSLRQLVKDRYARQLEAYKETFRQIEATQEENFAKMYMDIVRAGTHFHVRIPAGMLATMRTVGIFKSWVTFLDPDFHFMREVYRAILRSVDKDHLTNDVSYRPYEGNIEEALEDVMDWAAGVAEDNVGVYRQIDQQLQSLYA